MQILKYNINIILQITVNSEKNFHEHLLPYNFEAFYMKCFYIKCSMENRGYFALKPQIHDIFEKFSSLILNVLPIEKNTLND